MMTIDLDEAITSLESLISRIAIPNRHIEYGIRLAIQQLRNYHPVVDKFPVKEKKARWIIGNGGNPYCPICRKDVAEKTPYCPWCGVHMEWRAE